MKHADCPRARSTGESQLRFATREMMLTGFCITYHGENQESMTAWWEEAFRKGRAWRVCRVLPELHHVPWAKHTGWGGRTETQPVPPAAAGPDPEKSWLSSTEVKQEMGQWRLRKQMWQDEKGKTDFLALRLYSIRMQGGAVEGTWVHLAALLGSGCGRCVLVAGPRRVPKT